MKDDLIKRGDAAVLCDFYKGDDDAAVKIKYELLNSERAIPAVDAVERAVYEQVAWERDTAIAQLSDIGKGLGAKMDDVAKVVRCRECKMHGNCYAEDVFAVARLDDNKRFCGVGQRREDGDA